jgi:hypothetical protein
MHLRKRTVVERDAVLGGDDRQAGRTVMEHTDFQHGCFAPYPTVEPVSTSDGADWLRMPAERACSPVFVHDAVAAQTMDSGHQQDLADVL